MLQPFSNVFLRFKNSAQCVSAQNDTKILLSEFPTPYTSIIMNVTRIFLTSWLVVLVLSLGTNTIAAAAVGVAHEINCADRHDRAHSHDVAHKEPIQSSDNMMVMDADHDHETCMNHACPALFINVGSYQVDPQLMYSKLLYFEPSLRVIERVESLHRPPST